MPPILCLLSVDSGGLYPMIYLILLESNAGIFLALQFFNFLAQSCFPPSFNFKFQTFSSYIHFSSKQGRKIPPQNLTAPIQILPHFLKQILSLSFTLTKGLTRNNFLLICAATTKQNRANTKVYCLFHITSCFY